MIKESLQGIKKYLKEDEREEANGRGRRKGAIENLRNKWRWRY